LWIQKGKELKARKGIEGEGEKWADAFLKICNLHTPLK